MGLSFRVLAKTLARSFSVRVRGETVPTRLLKKIDSGLGVGVRIRVKV